MGGHPGINISNIYYHVTARSGVKLLSEYYSKFLLSTFKVRYRYIFDDNHLGDPDYGCKW